MFKHVKDKAMDLNDWISFCKDWNAKVPVDVLADKYSMSKSAVRNRVNSLRKKGVKLELRTRGPILDVDVDEINRSL